MNNFKIILTDVDTQPLLDQLAEHDDLWATESEWNRGQDALAHLENIPLRDFTLMANKDGYLLLNELRKSREEWDRPTLGWLTAAQDLLFQHLLPATRCTHLGRVSLTRLAPDASTPAHVDHWPALGGHVYWRRYRLQLQGKNVAFACGNEVLHPPRGTFLTFNNGLEHTITNHGPDWQIALLADIRSLTV
jgi:hypothetical protein